LPPVWAHRAYGASRGTASSMDCHNNNREGSAEGSVVVVVDWAVDYEMAVAVSQAAAASWVAGLGGGLGDGGGGLPVSGGDHECGHSGSDGSNCCDGQTHPGLRRLKVPRPMFQST